MKTRMIFLITVLAVMFGGTSAVGLADEHEPEANTGFVAQVSDQSIDQSITPDDETFYIQYHVCSLNEDADDYCDGVLDNFNPETFAWANEIAVTANQNGEFNHGSFVSDFAQGVETNGPGKGCLMRYIAESDWGQPDVEGYEVLEQAEIFCAFNKNGNPESAGQGEGRPEGAGEGKPAWAGPDGDKSQRLGQGEDD